MNLISEVDECTLFWSIELNLNDAEMKLLQESAEHVKSVMDVYDKMDV